MKNKKKGAIELFKLRNKMVGRRHVTKSDFKEEIRKIADNDVAFEYLVFELGCSVLTKALLKEKKKREEEKKRRKEKK